MERNLEEAKAWFEKAADVGHRDAQFVLGLIYRDGLGVKKALKDAEKWFKKAAGPADQESDMKTPREGSLAERDERDLMGVYRTGRVERERLLAEHEWYGKTAQQRHGEAQFILGEMHMDGLDETKSRETAMKRFMQATAQGHVDAQHRLGLAYWERGGARIGGLAKPSPTPRRWSVSARPLSRVTGMPTYRLGLAYWLRRGTEQGIAEAEAYNKAVECFRKAAEQGHRDAHYRLGLAYWLRRGTEQGIAEAESDAKAVECFRKAAKQGHADAQYCLGLAYWKRRVTEGGHCRSRVRRQGPWAVPWFRKAVAQDHVDAQYRLGLAYWRGRGTGQGVDEVESDAKAVECFRKAAQQGHADAQYHLGLAYRDGRGVPQCGHGIWLAAEWFRKAAKQGHACAQGPVSGANTVTVMVWRSTSTKAWTGSRRPPTKSMPT